MHPIRIGLIGDFDPAVLAHQAIPGALRLAGDSLGVSVAGIWLSTRSIDPEAIQQIVEHDGLWCVPASPYANPDGALAAIRLAREQGIPFIGTCGGFQHALIEYARNVVGLVEASHEEEVPDSSVPLVSRLSCSLVEERGEIFLQSGSRARDLCGADVIEEGYHCSFGLNPIYEATLQERGMLFTGRDAAGEVRVLELRNHPFFLATLFQPERSALRGETHPLIRGFVRAASEGAMLEGSKPRLPARS
jgi:CTP synthase (UTP-ammonia lyase)